MSNKTVPFIVEIDLSDKITTDDDRNEMAKNIARAIRRECENGEVGIAPENSDVITVGIYVRDWYTNKQYIEHP